MNTTRYEDGFLSKCAEHGLSMKQAKELMKVAARRLVKSSLARHSDRDHPFDNQSFDTHPWYESVNTRQMAKHDYDETLRDTPVYNSRENAIKGFKDFSNNLYLATNGTIDAAHPSGRTGLSQSRIIARDYLDDQRRRYLEMERGKVRDSLPGRSAKRTYDRLQAGMPLSEASKSPLGEWWSSFKQKLGRYSGAAARSAANEISGAHDKTKGMADIAYGKTMEAVQAAKDIRGMTRPNPERDNAVREENDKFRKELGLPAVAESFKNGLDLINDPEKLRRHNQEALNQMKWVKDQI